VSRTGSAVAWADPSTQEAARASVSRAKSVEACMLPIASAGENVQATRPRMKKKERKKALTSYFE